MTILLSNLLIGFGLILWLWGTPVFFSRRSVLFKLHNLSVSDTLGSISILVGLLFRRSNEWPLLILAIFSLMIWNTMLGYILAYCASQQVARRNQGG